jgi:putative ABC transport system ATP-binding protein
MSGALLSGRAVSLSIGAIRVLRKVSFEAAAGEVVAVMGPSGSGKSTLLHVLAGLLTPEGGEVWLDGKRVDQLSQRARSALRLTRMGFVFQFGDLIPELTLVENVELPLRLTGTDRRAARQLATGMLDRLEVAAVANRRVNEVSGGQAQRAAVARALVSDPVVVFADEPTGSLDTTAGELVLEALLGTARGQGTAVVLVTHEPRVASYADREVILRDGSVTAPMAASQVIW